jgi:hypothetical protein
LHPRDYHSQTQMILCILKLKARLPLHKNLLCNLHSVKTYRHLIIHYCFLCLGLPWQSGIF